MLNKSLFLNEKIFDANVEQLPIRKGFGEGLLVAGQDNAHVVALCADLTESTQMHLFKEKFPNRFVEIGVAEQNLASRASSAPGPPAACPQHTPPARAADHLPTGPG